MAEELAEKAQLPAEEDVEGALEEEEEDDEETNGVDGRAEAGGGDQEKAEAGGDGQDKVSVAVSVGPKVFTSSPEMFNYFLEILCSWPTNLDINKYEHMALLDLLKKGHPEPARKIGAGIKAFQVRHHPTYKRKCFFLVRVDGTSDDFSFRKCVDNLLPLPDHLKRRDNKNGSSQRGGGGRRGGRGSGRRGGFRK